MNPDDIIAELTALQAKKSSDPGSVTDADRARYGELVAMLEAAEGGGEPAPDPTPAPTPEFDPDKPMFETAPPGEEFDPDRPMFVGRGDEPTPPSKEEKEKPGFFARAWEGAKEAASTLGSAVVEGVTHPVQATGDFLAGASEGLGQVMSYPARLAFGEGKVTPEQVEALQLRAKARTPEGERIVPTYDKDFQEKDRLPAVHEVGGWVGEEIPFTVAGGPLSSLAGRGLRAVNNPLARRAATEAVETVGEGAIAGTQALAGGASLEEARDAAVMGGLASQAVKAVGKGYQAGKAKLAETTATMPGKIRAELDASPDVVHKLRERALGSNAPGGGAPEPTPTPTSGISPEEIAKLRERAGARGAEGAALYGAAGGPEKQAARMHGRAADQLELASKQFDDIVGGDAEARKAAGQWYKDKADLPEADLVDMAADANRARSMTDNAVEKQDVSMKMDDLEGPLPEAGRAKMQEVLGEWTTGEGRFEQMKGEIDPTAKRPVREAQAASERIWTLIDSGADLKTVAKEMDNLKRKLGSLQRAKIGKEWTQEVQRRYQVLRDILEDPNMVGDTLASRQKDLNPAWQNKILNSDALDTHTSSAAGRATEADSFVSTKNLDMNKLRKTLEQSGPDMMQDFDGLANGLKSEKDLLDAFARNYGFGSIPPDVQTMLDAARGGDSAARQALSEWADETLAKGHAGSVADRMSLENADSTTLATIIQASDRLGKSTAKLEEEFLQRGARNRLERAAGQVTSDELGKVRKFVGEKVGLPQTGTDYLERRARGGASTSGNLGLKTAEAAGAGARYAARVTAHQMSNQEVQDRLRARAQNRN